MHFGSRLLGRINPYLTMALSRSGTQATTFVAMLIAIRSLEAEVFGAFSVAWTTTVIANAVVYTGFGPYVLRARDVDTAKSTVFCLLCAQGTLFSLAMLLGAAAVHAAGNVQVSLSLAVLAPVPLVTAVCAWTDALLTRARRAEGVNIAQFLAELAGTAALLIGIRLGFQLAALLAWRSVSTLATLIGLWWLERPRPQLALSRDVAKEALQTALPLQGSMLVLSVSGYVAEFLLAGQLNTAVSGAYRAASRIAITSSSVFLGPMGPLTWTSLAEHERAGDVAAMRRTYAEHLKLMALFAFPTLSCLALFSERLFEALARQDWSSAGPVLGYLALARISDVLTFFMEPVLVCTARARLQFRLRTLTVVVFLIGVAFSSSHGAQAVSQWQLLYGALYAALATEVVCKTLQMSRVRALSALLPALATTGLCAAAGELSYRTLALAAPLRLSCSIAAMALTLGAAFLAFKRRGLVHLPKR